jgi:prepilin signal peptidase PulO-like enzyme (type II secretory pathway)
MEIAIAFVFAAFGLVIGSFLNVVIDRLPAGESLAFPPSHCSSCNHHLVAKDLVPVSSYAFLKGRCRYCGEHITLRIPIVEAATAVAFGLLFLKFPSTPASLAIALFYFCLLLVIAVIDLETGIILPIMVVPSIILAIIFSLLLPHSSFVPQIRSTLIGGGIGLGVMLLIFVLAYLWYHREAFGFGDVYLGTLMGVMLGAPRIVVGILSAVYVGAIIAIILVATRKKGMKQPIAFGEFLAIGTGIAFIWGIPIWNWYSNLFKF